MERNYGVDGEAGLMHSLQEDLSVPWILVRLRKLCNTML
jgi:hypothetical protein